MKEEQRNKRNLKYEKNFMKYLFRGNWERQKEICKSINVVESTEETRRARTMKTDEQIEEEFKELVRSGLTNEQFNQ